MKRIILIVLLCAAWVAMLRADPVTVDGVAAYVNDTVITVSEVREAMAPLVPQLREVYEGKDLDAKLKETFDDVLQGLIENKLIVRAYDADEKINKEAMDRHVERRVAEFIQDRFDGDRQEFLKALKDERMSYDEWRRRMRERLIVGMMRQKEVDSQVVVPPREVRRVYDDNVQKYSHPERVKLSVILIHGSAVETDRVTRLNLAVETLAKVRGGESFADAAKRVSEDGKAGQGGDWGWMDAADLRKELADPVRQLAPGALSGVLTVDGDFYLVRLEARQPAGVTPFDEVRVGIEKDLKKKESKRLYKVWIDRLRKDAYVEIVKLQGV